LLDRHAAVPWNQPLHRPTVEAFEALQECLADGEGGLILDSGCGTGESTRLLAARFPECLVVGVDKSLVRLQKTSVSSFPHRENNAVWLRAELASFWRLALAAGWRLERHYLFYPNPWPKPGQLQRRWHAHPVFPVLLRLGGRLEMRSNWKVYAQEFAFAVGRLTGSAVQAHVLDRAKPVSPFERKYRNSGHDIYQVIYSTC
jgi:tRNA G46 methylase TrmB